MEVLNLLGSPAIEVRGRFGTKHTSFQKHERLATFKECVLQRLRGNDQAQEADIEFDGLMLTKLEKKLSEMNEKDEKTSKDLDIVRSLTERLAYTAEERCRLYALDIHGIVRNHKKMLFQFAPIAAETLGLDKGEREILHDNLALHDWSKLCFYAGLMHTLILFAISNIHQ